MSDFLIGSFVAIVSTVVGGILSLFISRRIVRESEFVKSGSVFRSEFADMLWLLEKGEERDKNTIGDFFRLYQSSISKHNAAAIKFSTFLDNDTRKQFWLSYEEYRNPKYQKNSDIRGYLHYSAENADEERQIRIEVKDKLLNLLSFADILPPRRRNILGKYFYEIFHINFLLF